MRIFFKLQKMFSFINFENLFVFKKWIFISIIRSQISLIDFFFFFSRQQLLIFWVGNLKALLWYWNKMFLAGDVISVFYFKWNECKSIFNVFWNEPCITVYNAQFKPIYLESEMRFNKQSEIIATQQCLLK